MRALVGLDLLKVTFTSVGTGRRAEFEPSALTGVSRHFEEMLAWYPRLAGERNFEHYII